MSMADILLTRDRFRESVFARDGYKCVICGTSGVPLDAHHIIERRLWPDGGYYLSNGATVCETHHRAAESTTLSCADVRKAAGIAKVALPLHLYPDEEYDKWGNQILPNGQRLHGELFEDESVQRALAPVLNLFTEHVKYSRTYHLPWSPGLTNDDRVASDLSVLESCGRIIVTAKMDGENTSMYRDFIHARAVKMLDSHPSRTRVKTLWGNIAHEIPEGWRICAENLQGKHSIYYQNLRGWVYGFSIWNEKNICLSWDETVTWFDLLGIVPSPVLYDGPWNESLLRSLHKSVFDGDPCEGYVVRVADSFHYKNFRQTVAKYVRASHVQTHAHWLQRFTENRLAIL